MVILRVMKKASLIEFNPRICFGKPVFKGSRIPVYMVLELLAAGRSNEEVLRDYYPSLTEAHLRSSLEYATKLLQNEEVVLSQDASYAVAV